MHRLPPKRYRTASSAIHPDSTARTAPTVQEKLTLLHFPGTAAIRNAWECGAAFYRQHGHLAIPATAKLDDYAVGAWMRRQGKAASLTQEQAARLTALDELWRLEPDWNRSYRRLLACLAAGGTLDGPANRTGSADDPTFRPGTWLRKQDKARTDGKLTAQQTALLDALAAR
ncbi:MULTISPECIES: helicase associated domain-containing protein [unclassified Kitasatospora]|uniref:helicase associated domain-containing protein n=1 Tax=unclassified Kitasatospora TaxID=2633591 RepID=UPI0033C5CEE5